MTGEFRRRISAFFRRGRLETELEEEMRFHLESKMRETSDDAGSARRQFGNVTWHKEASRAEWGWAWLDSVLQDVRFALRMVRRSPGFAAVTAVSLGLGVGAATGMFSAIDALMFKVLPLAEPGRLVLFDRVEGNRTFDHFPYPWFVKLRDRTDAFSGLSASWPIDRASAGAGEGQVVNVAMATGNYFSNLGVTAAAGRTFTPADDRVPGGHPVAVLSDGFRTRCYGPGANVVGQSLRLSGVTYSVIGVTPPGFQGEQVGKPVDVWVPFMMASQIMPEVPGGPDRFPAVVMGRLKPGVTIEQAQSAAMIAYRQIIREETGEFNAQRRLALTPGATGYSAQRASLTPPLAILMALATLVLLISCANVATLLLARGAARQKEVGVRLSIGAGRARLVRQLMTESLVLAGAGGALGLLLAWLATSALAAMMAAGPVTAATAFVDLRPDGRVFAFVAVVSLFTALIFGLAPALRGSNLTLSSRGAASGRFGAGRVLAIAQVALSLVLLTGAGLFIRTLGNLRAQDLGFSRERLLLVWISPVQTGRTVPALEAFLRTVQDRISALPGIGSAAISNGGMLAGEDRGGASEDTNFQGLAPKPGLVLRSLAVTSGFFDTAGIALLSGRTFTERDTANGPPVAVISEAMARFFYGSENPIGRRFGGRKGDQMEIVGVVKNVKAGTIRDQRGVWYIPYGQSARLLRVPWCVVVRAAGDPAPVAAAVRRELAAIDRALPVLRVNTVEDQLSEAVAGERMIATLSSAFGAIALVLACVGLYGLLAFTASRRTGEIGIRLALGATPAGAAKLILRESLLLVAAGIAIGVPAALAAARLISARFFGVSPSDPETIAVAVALLIAIGLAAGSGPASRASRVDPAIALRAE